MFGFIQNLIIKRIIVDGVISKLDAALKKLPQNDAKTVTGILIACVGLVLSSVPESAPYIQPVIDYLKLLPANEIVAGGIAYSFVGAFHKVLKLILSYSHKDNDALNKILTNKDVGM